MKNMHRKARTVNCDRCDPISAARRLPKHRGRTEGEQASDHVGRQARDRCVVAHDAVIVVLPRKGNAIFRRAQLFLKRKKILVSAELRSRFGRYGGERLGEMVLDARAGRDVASGDVGLPADLGDGC